MDQLNVTLTLDEWTANELEALAPHKSVFNLDQPRVVSRNLSMPKPVVATISNFIHSKLEVDDQKMKQMKQMLC